MHYVEIATNILTTDPTDNNKAIREWAIETIGHYSEVALPSGAKEELEIHRLSAMINAIQQNAHEKRLETIVENERNSLNRAWTQCKALRGSPVFLLKSRPVLCITKQLGGGINRRIVL